MTYPTVSTWTKDCLHLLGVEVLLLISVHISRQRLGVGLLTKTAMTYYGTHLCGGVKRRAVGLHSAQHINRGRRGGISCKSICTNIRNVITVRPGRNRREIWILQV